MRVSDGTPASRNARCTYRNMDPMPDACWNALATSALTMLRRTGSVGLASSSSQSARSSLHRVRHAGVATVSSQPTSCGSPSSVFVSSRRSSASSSDNVLERTRRAWSLVKSHCGNSGMRRTAKPSNAGMAVPVATVSRQATRTGRFKNLGEKQRPPRMQPRHTKPSGCEVRPRCSDDGLSSPA
ncbi:Os07g0582900 [Oryza sativa Japonica Group]|uniref:Os07g0582900 protein n=1 Tax=Oryza sativa subsp. japonica TaxID=39947 RepID=Q6ZFM1_ORYSJ|nr:unknown protein [Oryza sativa Japonica Group]BAF22026.1 Os07g0582900 [Oryza sativa Japonica Group]|eukprot:NP_001060112.1 Os07g0582900 [Oryza sativa Japonica Group]